MVINAFIVLSLVVVSIAKPFGDRRRVPGKAMTWTGWLPGDGLSMFTSSDYPWDQSMYFPSIDTSSFKGSNEENQNSKPLPNDLKNTKKPSEASSMRKQLYNMLRKEFEDDSDQKKYLGSQSNASINAWFPIMFGASGNERGLEMEYQDDEPKKATALANSINHGKSGVASSHAIVYSGQPPAYYSSRRH